MKILVFSDSHGQREFMCRAIEQERPDRVFHLGDVVGDCRQLRERFPELPIDQVRGNCDSSGCGIPEEQELILGGKRLWLLHGHTYWVKMGQHLLVSEARTRGVDGVFFGHTHVPLCYLDGSLWVLNPGTVGGIPRATYGIVEIGDNKIYCRTAVMG